MPLHLSELVEWVGAAQFAGVNQAREQVADGGPILGLVEQRVLPVQNRFLQCSFANVIVQRGSRLPLEQREPLPGLEQTPNRQSQTGVRFHFLFRELGPQVFLFCFCQNLQKRLSLLPPSAFSRISQLAAHGFLERLGRCNSQ
jgi:hypothetical protein